MVECLCALYRVKEQNTPLRMRSPLERVLSSLDSIGETVIVCALVLASVQADSTADVEHSSEATVGHVTAPALAQLTQRAEGEVSTKVVAVANGDHEDAAHTAKQLMEEVRPESRCILFGNPNRSDLH